MALRLGELADLDPSAVPLPAGTEVVTRVDRAVDGELRLQGATGRVTRIDGDRVDVTFVDGIAIRWLSGEPPSVIVSDALRPTVLAIKRGDVAMIEVL